MLQESAIIISRRVQKSHQNQTYDFISTTCFKSLYYILKIKHNKIASVLFSSINSRAFNK